MHHFILLLQGSDDRAIIPSLCCSSISITSFLSFWLLSFFYLYFLHCFPAYFSVPYSISLWLYSSLGALWFILYFWVNVAFSISVSFLSSVNFFLLFPSYLDLLLFIIFEFLVQIVFVTLSLQAGLDIFNHTLKVDFFSFVLLPVFRKEDFIQLAYATFSFLIFYNSLIWTYWASSCSLLRYLGV